MKRRIGVLVLIGLLLVGSAVAMADPIQVGGSCLMSSSQLVSRPGNGHAWGRGFRAAAWKDLLVESESLMLLSPIQVGGS